MAVLARQLPIRRAELRISPLGDKGQYVVKDPHTGDYFQIGEEEHFLLMQFNGTQEAEAICSAFQQRFDQPLSAAELDAFLVMARGQRLITTPNGQDGNPPVEQGDSDGRIESLAVAPSRVQSLLYWRKSIFDPDRLFTWLEPKIRFLWTTGFLVFSATCIVSATVVLWTSRLELTGGLQRAQRWDTILWTWLILLTVTTLHEFAHGLTCKHYGGEVREIGFLLMFFMPCFYCNVSDAWLIRQKSKRLWVTFAGGYFELFLWALAVCIWRITMPGSLINYLAFLVLASSGIGTLFNFNPLLKLDGYYMLSDWLEVPNLQQRSVGYFKAQLRHLLWGAPPPNPVPRKGTLLVYGLISWLYSGTFLFLMLWVMFRFCGHKWGVIGMSAVTLLGLVSSRGLLRDTVAEEARRMFSERQRRLAAWIMVLAGVAAVLCMVEINDYASGPFEVRAQRRAQLRAAAAGFLTEVNYDEGQNVEPNSIVARLTIPNLESRVAQKRSQLREAEARLRLLRAGPREVEIAQQRGRVAAVMAWRDVAAEELECEKHAFELDMRRFDKLLEEYRAECAYARQALARVEKLRPANAVTEDEVLNAQKECLVRQARCERAEAEKQVRVALGTLTAQSKLAERENELAGERAALALLEAGNRPEEIETAEATVARLNEELAYLSVIRARLVIYSPVAGSITTSRLKEKIGDYFAEGDLICEVEDASTLEVAIALDEDQAARIQPRQNVRFKARSLPFHVLEAKIERLAPRASKGDAQNTLTAYCQLVDADGRLRPGMSGTARVKCGHGPIASVLAMKVMRLVRTEFWW